jgi:hypothetical protein
MVEMPLTIVLMVIGAFLIIAALYQTAYIVHVELSPGDGLELRPGQAPTLFGRLDSLCREFHCRPFDRVLVTMDFNACVRQIPRLGLFGWPRTNLEIGLILALAVKPEELHAILAHEVGHLSAGPGPNGCGTYLLRKTWHDVIAKMERPARSGLEWALRWAILKILQWYWPRLNARLLVLSRVHEYRADADAARVAGTTAPAMALWRLECLGSWLGDSFWPELLKKAAQDPEPPEDVLQILADAFPSAPSHQDVPLWVDRGLSRTTIDETHPAFLARVRPFGLTADAVRQIGFPAAARPSAAEVFFEAALPGLQR